MSFRIVIVDFEQILGQRLIASNIITKDDNIFSEHCPNVFIIPYLSQFEHILHKYLIPHFSITLTNVKRLKTLNVKRLYTNHFYFYCHM